MPLQQKKKAKGLPKRTGNPVRKARRIRYYSSSAKWGHGYIHNKLSNIIRRNGPDAADAWDRARPLMGGATILLRLLRERSARTNSAP